MLLTTCLYVPAVDGLRDSLKCPVRVLKGGRVRIRSKGRVAKYVCLRGSQVLGDKYSTCVRGKWDSPVPVCINSGCLPVDVPHGQVLETYRGALVTVHCDPGYALIGSQSLYCNGAVWNGTAPICKEVQVTAQKWCDFESEDLCGWTHDLNHDFDWTRHNFATPSGHVGTGPSFDHTLGPGLNGHYMYLEVSSPRLENDTARLFSPVFNAISDSEACFIFWYHMYGSTIGTLNVYLHKQDTNLLFNKSGDQGNQWLQAVLPLPKINNSFQIVMEGVRGAGYEGDIAIDDVKLAGGEECSMTTSVTPTADDLVTVAEEATSSCEGRCLVPTTEPSMCECTVDCVGNNTCCPDYVLKCSQDATSRVGTTTGNPNTSSEASRTTSRSESLTTLYKTTTNSLAMSETNLATSTSSYHRTLNESFPLNVTSKTSQLTSYPVTPAFSRSSPTVTMAPKSTHLLTIITPVTNQTEVKPNSTYIVATTKFTILTNVTAPTTNTVSTTSKIVFTKTTVSPTIPNYNQTNTLQENQRSTLTKTIWTTKKPTIKFVTPPPPVVFQKPVKTVWWPFTRYILRELYTPPTTVTTQSSKRMFNRTEKMSKSKNDVLHPVWLKDPPTTPMLPPLGPNPKSMTSKATTPTTSPPTASLPSNTLYLRQSDPTSPSTKWRSKYKPREEQPVHALYAVSSSPSGNMVHIIVLVSGVLLILVVALATVCVMRRRKINRRRMEDDELDIQFLASDEILDFTLARPSMEGIQMKETRR